MQVQHLVFRAAQQGACAGVEDGVRGRSRRRGALLGDLVLQVLDEQLVGAFVQHCKAVARDENRRTPHAPLWILATRKKQQHSDMKSGDMQPSLMDICLGHQAALDLPSFFDIVKHEDLAVASVSQHTACRGTGTF